MRAAQSAWRNGSLHDWIIAVSDVSRVGSLQAKFSFSRVVAVDWLVAHLGDSIVCNFMWSVFVEFLDFALLLSVNLYEMSSLSI